MFVIRELIHLIKNKQLKLKSYTIFVTQQIHEILIKCIKYVVKSISLIFSSNKLLTGNYGPDLKHLQFHLPFMSCTNVVFEI